MRSRSCPVIFGILFLVLATPTTAAPLSLALDSALSTLELKLTYRNSFGDELTLVEQSPGSLAAHFLGSAEVELFPGQISLAISGDAIKLQGTYAPGGPFPSPRILEPADVAGQVLNPDPLGQGFYAVRDLMIELGSLPISIDDAGDFAVGAILVAVNGTRAAFTGTSDGTGVSTLQTKAIVGFDQAAALGSFEQVGSMAVLTLPVEIPWPVGIFSSALTPVSGSLRGTIIATALVPEPRSWLLAAIASAGVAGLYFFERCRADPKVLASRC